MAWRQNINVLRNSAYVIERKIQGIVKIPEILNVMDEERPYFVKQLLS